ncbi:hypothetical protein BRC97_09250 [Halobacteriales archaeon QS_6_71_20]|nr:MAG: hypothetical protein BRC97_09250 [Halobacteriales archaeon QS_6_71_20]
MTRRRVGRSEHLSAAAAEEIQRRHDESSDPDGPRGPRETALQDSGRFAGPEQQDRQPDRQEGDASADRSP